MTKSEQRQIRKQNVREGRPWNFGLEISIPTISSKRTLARKASRKRAEARRAQEACNG